MFLAILGEAQAACACENGQKVNSPTSMAFWAKHSYVEGKMARIRRSGKSETTKRRGWLRRRRSSVGGRREPGIDVALNRTTTDAESSTARSCRNDLSRTTRVGRWRHASTQPAKLAAAEAASGAGGPLTRRDTTPRPAAGTVTTRVVVSARAPSRRIALCIRSGVITLATR